MGLDVGHLQGQEKTVTVKVDGGEFDVEYRPHAATRTWQFEFGNLQREVIEAIQDDDMKERDRVNEELTQRLSDLIISWDLSNNGEDIPVTAAGLDQLSLPLMNQLFEQVIQDASGGTREERRAAKKRSRKG